MLLRGQLGKHVGQPVSDAELQEVLRRSLGVASQITLADSLLDHCREPLERAVALRRQARPHRRKNRAAISGKEWRIPVREPPMAFFAESPQLIDVPPRPSLLTRKRRGATGPRASSGCANA